MEHETKTARRLSPRAIAIIVLALIVLAEGAFLLLNRSPDGGNTDKSAVAAAGTDSAGSDASENDAQADSNDPDAAEDSSSTADASGSGKVDSDDSSKTDSGNSPEKSGGKSADKSGSGGAQAPAQTPVPTIPDQNRGKPYAGAIAILQNYIDTPTPDTLGYLLGGELTGDQMQRFIPAVLTLSGQSFDQMQTQISADLNLPQGASALVIANETRLSQEQLSAAAIQMNTQLDNYQSISESFKEYKGFNSSEWEQVGSQFGMSGTEAKKLILDIGDSAAVMSDRLSGAAITDGYDVTLQASNGETLQITVFCINGKWVTGAFFDTQI